VLGHRLRDAQRTSNLGDRTGQRLRGALHRDAPQRVDKYVSGRLSVNLHDSHGVVHRDRLLTLLRRADEGRRHARRNTAGQMPASPKGHVSDGEMRDSVGRGLTHVLQKT